MSKNKKKNQPRNQKKVYPKPRNWFGDSGTQKIRRKLNKKGRIDGKKLA